MAGRKLFTNTTRFVLAVKLRVRSSDDPRNTAGVREFSLQPGESQWVEYGNSVDIYLNGIDISGILDATLVGQRHIVVTRGSALDDQLNRANGVDFLYQAPEFTIATRQVS